jgi:hypothetical protein
MRSSGPWPWAPAHLRELRRASHRVAEGHLDTRLASNGSDELADYEDATGMAPDTATAVRLETGWAVIEVRDSGPGIPADILPRVFDRSCTSDTARTRTEGSGLGLSICGIPETGVVEVGEPATGIRSAQVLLPWGTGRGTGTARVQLICTADAARLIASPDADTASTRVTVILIRTWR